MVLLVWLQRRPLSLFSPGQRPQQQVPVRLQQAQV
jgi:hypothetical protein